MSEETFNFADLGVQRGDAINWWPNAGCDPQQGGTGSVLKVGNESIAALVTTPDGAMAHHDHVWHISDPRCQSQAERLDGIDVSCFDLAPSVRIPRQMDARMSALERGLADLVVQVERLAQPTEVPAKTPRLAKK